jgi:hypothetical protein
VASQSLVRREPRPRLDTPPAPARLVVVVEVESPVEPDETLVADARGGFSPSQVVDQRVLALTQSGHPGLHVQASGRPRDIRRLPAGPRGS